MRTGPENPTDNICPDDIDKDKTSENQGNIPPSPTPSTPEFANGDWTDSPEQRLTRRFKNSQVVDYSTFKEKLRVASDEYSSHKSGMASRDWDFLSELREPPERTVRCADGVCGRDCKHGLTPCQRPVITYGRPQQITLEMLRESLNDPWASRHAIQSDHFENLLKDACEKFNAGDLETAEQLIERVLEIFINSQRSTSAGGRVDRSAGQ